MSEPKVNTISVLPRSVPAIFCPNLVPEHRWDTQLTIFIGVMAVFALCPAIFEKMRHIVLQQNKPNG
jgi:hypothetical protein